MSVDKMKGLLLRVGIDKGTGGSLAPIFQDGSFEYIPIPETCATSESNVYKSMKGRCSKPLTDFVKKNHWYSHLHHDPEFTTYTYGDPASPKRNQLSGLLPGDMLLFYAGLEPKEGWAGKPRLFIIGYFTIEKVYDFKKEPKAKWEKVFNQVPNNAHSKIYNRLKALNVEYSDDNLVIVRGCPKNSRLFPKALPLGDDNDHPLKNIQPIIGYAKSLRRAVGHEVDENHMQKVKEWLEHSNPRDNKTKNIGKEESLC